ncbi:hypothetical protein EDC19_1171 [Natranaerovirga hydrolytica]|uniref:Uncharacterized protein n=1 Tax=Natranaerovirga hydrolytica TaxID=680378 RepID=A0A4R1MZM4_9FIRM|nr:hypothetical protein EDC19_1171 [Natranaerovirga hydrolytica]
MLRHMYKKAFEQSRVNVDTIIKNLGIKDE